MEQRNADVRPVTERGTAGDDAVRFLTELRQLRDGAELGQAELAARAHYPYDRIKAAEAGPALPDLPVLSAYVRACGGTTEEWEERWRSLTRTPSLPVSEARTAGQSPAATAGARISAVAQDASAPNPAVILAALHRVAEEMAGVANDTLPEPAPAATAPAFAAPAGTAPAAPAAPAEPRADAQPGADAKPSGWDPIRVSSAWPVIPASAGDSGTFGAAGAARASGTPTPTPGRGSRSKGSKEPWSAAPWSAAPWAADPWAADPSARGAGTEAAGPALGRGAAPGRGPALGRGAAPGRGPAPGWRPSGPVFAAAAGSGLSARAKIVAVAAILLCVLAVLLAIFA